MSHLDQIERCKRMNPKASILEFLTGVEKCRFPTAKQLLALDNIEANLKKWGGAKHRVKSMAVKCTFSMDFNAAAKWLKSEYGISDEDVEALEQYSAIIVDLVSRGVNRE